MGYLGVYPQMGYLGSYGHMGVSGDVPQMTPGYRGLRGVKASIASRGYLGLFEACIGPIWRVSTGGAPEGHLGVYWPHTPKWGYIGHMGVSGDVPPDDPGYRGLRPAKASIASRGYLGLY